MNRADPRTSLVRPDAAGAYQVPTASIGTTTVSFRSDHYVDGDVTLFAAGTDRTYLIELPYGPRVVYDGNSNRERVVSIDRRDYLGSPRGTGSQVTVLGNLACTYNGGRHGGVRRSRASRWSKRLRCEIL